jgi:hypothetical protein
MDGRLGVRRAVEGGIIFFLPPTSTTAAREESDHRACCRGSSRDARIRRRDEVTAARCQREQQALTEASSRRSTRRNGSGSTTSVCRSTAGIRSRRSRRRWRRCDVVARARRGTSAEQHGRLAVAKRSQCTDAGRVDAEPLQPRLPRRGAGDDPAVHQPGRGGAAVGCPRARPCSPGTARGRPAGGNARADRSVRRSLYVPELDFQSSTDRRSAKARGVPAARVRLPGCCTGPA